jgi:hypothetical protein
LKGAVRDDGVAMQIGVEDIHAFILGGLLWASREQGR